MKQWQWYVRMPRKTAAALVWSCKEAVLVRSTESWYLTGTFQRKFTVNHSKSGSFQLSKLLVQRTLQLSYQIIIYWVWVMIEWTREWFGTCHKWKNTDGTNNINDHFVSFRCPNKPWQGDSEPALTWGLCRWSNWIQPSFSHHGM